MRHPMEPTRGADDGVGKASGAQGPLARILVVENAAGVQLHDGDIRLARSFIVPDLRVALDAGRRHQHHRGPRLPEALDASLDLRGKSSATMLCPSCIYTPWITPTTFKSPVVEHAGRVAAGAA